MGGSTGSANEPRDALEETEGEPVANGDPIRDASASGSTGASVAVQKKVIPAMPSASASTASGRSHQSTEARLRHRLALIDEQEPEPEPEPELLLVASLVEKPANLGGLCRTCEALGLSLAFAHTPELLRAPDFRDPFQTDALELPDEQPSAACREAPKADVEYGDGLASAGGCSDLAALADAENASSFQCDEAKSTDDASSSRKKRSTRKETAKGRHKHKKEEEIACTAAGGAEEDVTGAVAFRALSVSSVGWLLDAGRLVDLRPDRLRAFLQARRAEGYRVVALEQTDRSVPLPSYQFPPRCVLLLG